MATLPDASPPQVPAADFPVVLRGYDRIAVDAYVKKTSELVAELQATRSPDTAVRRALERVGEEISGILQRAHDTADQVTRQSRREAEDRLEVARAEALEIVRVAEDRVKELDADTDRIWAERERIVEDARDLARQMVALADEAAARFPPAEAADAQVVEDDELGPDARSERDPSHSELDSRGVELDPTRAEFDPTRAEFDPTRAELDAAGSEPQPPRPEPEEDNVFDPEATAILPPAHPHDDRRSDR